jgi:hypothetical protein
MEEEYSSYNISPEKQEAKYVYVVASAPSIIGNRKNLRLWPTN